MNDNTPPGYKHCISCGLNKVRRAFTISDVQCDTCNEEIQHVNKSIQKHVIYNQHNDCIIWTGATSGDGHARIKILGKTRSLKQWLYNNTHDEDAHKGTHILQTCGDARCVNPNHLVTLHQIEQEQVKENEEAFKARKEQDEIDRLDKTFPDRDIYATDSKNYKYKSKPKK